MVERKLHPHHFFNKDEKEKIVDAIRAAEGGTTGDILLHIEHHSGTRILEKAKKILEWQRRRKKDAVPVVLIYLSIKDRAFVILGDEAIHRKVGDLFWNALSESLKKYFSKGEFVLGLNDIIAQIGREFKTHFPRSVS